MGAVTYLQAQADLAAGGDDAEVDTQEALKALSHTLSKLLARLEKAESGW